MYRRKDVMKVYVIIIIIIKAAKPVMTIFQAGNVYFYLLAADSASLVQVTRKLFMQ